MSDAWERYVRSEHAKVTELRARLVEVERERDEARERVKDLEPHVIGGFPTEVETLRERVGILETALRDLLDAPLVARTMVAYTPQAKRAASALAGGSVPSPPAPTFLGEWATPTALAAHMARQGLHDLTTWWDPERGDVDPLEDPETRAAIRSFIASVFKAAMDARAVSGVTPERPT